jgi:hypothetical protein
MISCDARTSLSANSHIAIRHQFMFMRQPAGRSSGNDVRPEFSEHLCDGVNVWVNFLFFEFSHGCVVAFVKIRWCFPHTSVCRSSKMNIAATDATAAVVVGAPVHTYIFNIIFILYIHNFLCIFFRSFFSFQHYGSLLYGKESMLWCRCCCVAM